MKTELKTYKIPCSWEMYGYHKIEAFSLDEAVEKADEGDRNLPQGDYIDASFRIDHDIVHELNEEEN